MKKNDSVTFLLLFAIVIFSTNSAKAGKGVVLVMEAPLFKSPSFDGKVAQRAKKGDIIYIHERHFTGEPELIRYMQKNDIFEDDLEEAQGLKFLDDGKKDLDTSLVDDVEFLEQGNDAQLPVDESIGDKYKRTDFYTTLDRNGLTRYIPKEYVKLIYKDEREEGESINPFESDPTDYRIKDQLSDFHPFQFKNDIRSYGSFGVGTESKSSYDYTSSVLSETFGSKYFLAGTILRKAEINSETSLYFGGRFGASRSNNDFILEGQNVNSSENRENFFVGPFFLFDVMKWQNVLFSFVGGVMVNFKTVSITQSETNTNIEEVRIYSGFTFSPEIGALITWGKKVSGLNLISEFTLKTDLPHTLESNALGTNDSVLWNNNDLDQYSSDFNASFNASVGLQISI